MDEMKGDIPFVKPCPFCGGSNLSIAYLVNVVICKDCDAEITYSAPGRNWNTRPLEDALLARAEKAEARVKVCQKGYNFADKLPETGERVLFKNWNGHFMLLTFEVNLSGNCLFHDDSDKRHSYDIADTRFEYFWYPLPVTSEDND